MNIYILALSLILSIGLAFGADIEHNKSNDFNAATAYFYNKQFDQALKTALNIVIYLEKSQLSTISKSSIITKADVLAFIGDCYSAKEQYSTALKWYNKALNIDKTNSIYIQKIINSYGDFSHLVASAVLDNDEKIQALMTVDEEYLEFINKNLTNKHKDFKDTVTLHYLGLVSNLNCLSKKNNSLCFKALKDLQVLVNDLSLALANKITCDWVELKLKYNILSYSLHLLYLEHQQLKKQKLRAHKSKMTNLIKSFGMIIEKLNILLKETNNYTNKLKSYKLNIDDTQDLFNISYLDDIRNLQEAFGISKQIEEKIKEHLINTILEHTELIQNNNQVTEIKNILNNLGAIKTYLDSTNKAQILPKILEYEIKFCSILIKSSDNELVQKALDSLEYIIQNGSGETKAKAALIYGEYYKHTNNKNLALKTFKCLKNIDKKHKEIFSKAQSLIIEYGLKLAQFELDNIKNETITPTQEKTINSYISPIENQVNNQIKLKISFIKAQLLLKKKDKSNIKDILKVLINLKNNIQFKSFIDSSFNKALADAHYIHARQIVEGTQPESKQSEAIAHLIEAYKLGQGLDTSILTFINSIISEKQITISSSELENLLKIIQELEKKASNLDLIAACKQKLLFQQALINISEDNIQKVEQAIEFLHKNKSDNSKFIIDGYKHLSYLYTKKPSVKETKQALTYFISALNNTEQQEIKNVLSNCIKQMLILQTDIQLSLEKLTLEAINKAEKLYQDHQIYLSEQSYQELINKISEYKLQYLSACFNKKNTESKNYQELLKIAKNILEKGSDKTKEEAASYLDLIEKHTQIKLTKKEAKKKQDSKLIIPEIQEIAQPAIEQVNLPTKEETIVPDPFKQNIDFINGIKCAQEAIKRYASNTNISYEKAIEISQKASDKLYRSKSNAEQVPSALKLLHQALCAGYLKAGLELYLIYSSDGKILPRCKMEYNRKDKNWHEKYAKKAAKALNIIRDNKLRFLNGTVKNSQDLFFKGAAYAYLEYVIDHALKVKIDNNNPKIQEIIQEAEKYKKNIIEPEVISSEDDLDSYSSDDSITLPDPQEEARINEFIKQSTVNYNF